MLFLITACSSKNNHDTETPSENDNPIQNSHDEENNDTNDNKEDGDKKSPETKDNNENNNAAENSSNHANHNVQTQEEIINEIAKQENTSFSFQMPTELPIDETKYLTGTTESKENYFTAVFYQTEDQIALNDKQLENGQKDKIARLQVEQYDSEQATNEEIGFEKYAETGGEEVDLGYNLTAYQDAGAGSVFTNWNEGRWALSTRASSKDNEQGVQTAKDAVEFLETHKLPAPQKHGSVKLDANGDDNMIMWQDGSIIYTIDHVKKPLDALRIATTFE